MIANPKGVLVMVWEYRQLMVNTKGWIDLKVSDDYLEHLNRLAREGWEVDQMIPLHTGIGGTSSVVFLLKRKLETRVK